MRRLHGVLAAAAFLSLSACGSDQRPEVAIGTSTAPVIRGLLDSGSAHDTVVYLSFVVDASAGIGGACTGTLIAPNVIATARHCVSNLDETVYPPRVGADFAPSAIDVYLHTNPTGIGATHAPDGKGFRIVHDDATTLDNSDFALLVTQFAVSTDYAQIRLATAPIRSESVFVVGYGVTETYTDTTPEPFQRYWRDGLPILGVGPLSGFIGTREIYLGESICQGDSGGPVMDHATGALLAVTSRGGNGDKATKTDPSAPCTGVHAQNIFTRVDAYADLIRSTLADYGRIPWEEGAAKPAEPSGPPPPGPGELGAPCSGPTECDSKICVDTGAGTQLCSQPCTDATPCPTGFDCAGYCIPTPRSVADAGVAPIDDAGDAAASDASDDGSSEGATSSSSKGCSMANRSSTTRGSSRVGLASMALAALMIARGRTRARQKRRGSEGTFRP